MAHIAGVPVEETLGMFAPVVGVIVAAGRATIRTRLRQLRDTRRPENQPSRARRQ